MTRRSNVIQIRVSDEEKEQIKENARRAGRKPSDFVRLRALEAALGPSSERSALSAEGSSDRAETATPVSPRASYSPKAFVKPIPKGQ